MATAENYNPSDTEITSAWEVYKDSGSALRSRATSLLIVQGVLAVAFVASATMHGDFNTTIGMFVLSLLVGLAGLFVSILAKPKFDSLVDGMSHLKDTYLSRWKVFGDAFGNGGGHGDGNSATDYLKLVPDVFAMFWVAAILVDGYLLIVTLDALHAVEGAVAH